MAASIIAPSPAAAALPRFGNAQAGSVGIGMEWMVLDRETHDLRPAAPDILLALDRQAKAWTATQGNDASTLEVATSMLGSHLEASDQVEDIRRSVRRAAGVAGVAVAGGGAHPLQSWSEQRIPAGDAPSGLLPGFGMRVQIGVTCADEAVRVCAWLSQRAPLFIALSASSPYWQGMDSGYCSMRDNVIGVFQASGIMPASLRSWKDFAHHVAQLAQRGLIAGFQDVDWDVRPDPEHGTVELRALDAPLHPVYAAALACYARELCLEVAERPGTWPCRSAGELYQWNRFNAAKRGVLGDWIDPCTRKKHTIEHVVRDDLGRLLARSNDPDFPNACVLIHELLHNGGQARWLTAHTATGGRPDEAMRLASDMFERPLAPGSEVES